MFIESAIVIYALELDISRNAGGVPLTSNRRLDFGATMSASTT